MHLLIAPDTLVKILKEKSERLADIFTSRLSSIYEIKDDIKKDLSKGIYITLSEAIYGYLMSGKPDLGRLRIGIKMVRKTQLDFSPKILALDGINVVSFEVPREISLQLAFVEKALLYKDIAENKVLINEFSHLMNFIDAYANYLGIKRNYNPRKKVEILGRILLKKVEITFIDLIVLVRMISRMVLYSNELKSIAIPLFGSVKNEKLKGFKYSRGSLIRDVEFEFEKIAKRS